MNVRQLSYFMEVYKQGSIAGAAKTLFISPQGVSKTILSLEEELSVELFVRKGRKLVPTQDAISFCVWRNFPTMTCSHTWTKILWSLA